ncbi:hypothetical protein Loa_02098 [Legionella oakridgensis ATCC 33761 = DSM 21215]|uniref:Glyoxalase n=2 Tax=Legionella oakridgensis TaxID=29423 RepID=W0BG92_9GAMM|nr:hypothetical protein Loa_02098 [Legionella oakridgensis ATCC 33761 = DSM 21215]
MYPRHFGVTFVDKTKFDDLLNKARMNKAPFFQELFVRFPGQKEEHYTFFLKDPSNNLLEFKFYLDPDMRY